MLFCQSTLSFVCYFLMFSSANSYLTVLTEQCGATTLHNSLKGGHQSFLVSLTSWHWSFGVNILLLLGVGMFSVQPHIWYLSRKLPMVDQGRFTWAAIWPRVCFDLCRAIISPFSNSDWCPVAYFVMVVVWEGLDRGGCF